MPEGRIPLAQAASYVAAAPKSNAAYLAIGEAMKEFRPHLGHCKFNDCAHLNEPGCAVMEAATRGEITPQALTEACLQQIERLNPKINAFITVLDVIARSEATKQSPGSLARPLSGLPLALKDYLAYLEDIATVRDLQRRATQPHAERHHHLPGEGQP